MAVRFEKTQRLTASESTGTSLSQNLQDALNAAEQTYGASQNNPIATVQQTITPEWSIESPFLAWTSCTHNSKRFMCLQTHTSSEESEPEVGETWYQYWILELNGLSDDQRVAADAASEPNADNPFTTQADLGAAVDGMIGTVYQLSAGFDPDFKVKCSLAYIEPTDESSYQINSDQTWIMIGWVQDGNERFSRISLRRSACAVVQGLNCSLYEATGYRGDPTGAFLGGASMNMAPGAGWSSGSPFQPHLLNDGKSYCLVFNGGTGIDVSIGYNRNNTSITSALPDNCWAKYSTDGGSTWTPLTKDSRDALFEFVINSTTHHSPQLVYVSGSRGASAPVYSAESGSWELRFGGGTSYLKPVLSCETLTADTLYYLYVSDGDPEAPLRLVLEASETPPEFTSPEGFMCMTDDPSKLFVGVFVPIERQTGYSAPIDCEQRRLVHNVYNQPPLKLGKKCPYVEDTGGELTTLKRWNDSDDYRVEFCCSTPVSVSLDGNVNWTGQYTLICEGESAPADIAQYDGPVTVGSGGEANPRFRHTFPPGVYCLTPWGKGTFTYYDETTTDSPIRATLQGFIMQG